MKPVIQSHLNYRGSLTRRLQRRWISWRSQPASVREIFLRFRNLDLSAVDRIMMVCYSSFGPKPRQPSCMLRSLLLMIITKCVSIPCWVTTLHTSPFYAILSGFDPDDLPGVGSFYDFITRLVLPVLAFPPSFWLCLLLIPKLALWFGFLFWGPPHLQNYFFPNFACSTK